MKNFRFCYNPGHNILEFYNILVQVRFTTSTTKLEFQYSKLGIRVADRFKTKDIRKLGYIRKISNLARHIAQCPVSLRKTMSLHAHLPIRTVQSFLAPNTSTQPNPTTLKVHIFPSTQNMYLPIPTYPYSPM